MVEFRTPSPRPDPGMMSVQQLLEELVESLREIAMRDRDLPSGDKVKSAIERVCSLKRELDRLGESTDTTISELNRTTGWDFKTILTESLTYPVTTPHRRGADGVREIFRCTLCKRIERPAKSKSFWYCDACIVRIRSALEDRINLYGIILFRTYSSGARCAHATDDTVLFADYNSDIIAGNCATCLDDELEYRVRVNT